MGLNPIPYLLVAVLGIIFTFALEGNTLATDSFPTPSQADPDTCGSGGFFSSIECGISTGVTFVINAFKVIYGSFVFLFRAVTFDVPDAPWYARIPITIIIGGSTTIAIVSIIRGN